MTIQEGICSDDQDDPLGQTPGRRAKTRLGFTSAAALATTLLVLATTAASAQWLTLPVDVPSALLWNFTSELSYTIDLGTLPTRPVLVVEVTPDAAHPDMLLEIEINNFVGNLDGPGGGCAIPRTSMPVVGAISLEFSVIQCDPRPGAFTGQALDVLVRPLSFGSSRAPANVQVVIRGETRVPTGELRAAVDTNVNSQRLFAFPTKDTVIYNSNTGASNGSGLSLWAGKDYSVIFPGTIRRDAMRPLIGFNFSNDLPFNAVIQNAELELFVQEFLGAGGNLAVARVAAATSGASWFEGTAVGGGTGFTGGSNTVQAADWLRRNGTTNFWTAPGGDTTGPILDTLFVNSTGYQRLVGLAGAVQNMHDEGRSADGFILFGPFNFLQFSDEGVRIASREASSSISPLLIIDYAAAAPWSDGGVPTSAVSFINEGEDFRWIYDVNPTDPIADDIYTTSIGGVCTVTEPDPFNFGSIPYTYSFAGAPGYTGLDCCTWQIDAPETATVGTGQAIFFHNLDPLDPANLPPDTDGDGIRDLCDNCLNTPNGPQLGSCLGGPTPGATCNNESECGLAGTCDLSQTDSDADFEGDACAVPEPGLATGLLVGAAGLALRARGRSERMIGGSSA